MKIRWKCKRRRHIWKWIKLDNVGRGVGHRSCKTLPKKYTFWQGKTSLSFAIWFIYIKDCAAVQIIEFGRNQNLCIVKWSTMCPMIPPCVRGSNFVNWLCDTRMTLHSQMIFLAKLPDDRHKPCSDMEKIPPYKSVLEIVLFLPRILEAKLLDSSSLWRQALIVAAAILNKKIIWRKIWRKSFTWGAPCLLFLC